MARSLGFLAMTRGLGLAAVTARCRGGLRFGTGKSNANKTRKNHTSEKQIETHDHLTSCVNHRPYLRQANHLPFPKATPWS